MTDGDFGENGTDRLISRPKTDTVGDNEDPKSIVGSPGFLVSPLLNDRLYVFRMCHNG